MSSFDTSSMTRFGIPQLDAVLGGGFPNGTTILIEDEVGVNSDPLLLSYLAEGLRLGEFGYIVSTEHDFEHYIVQMPPFGISDVAFETRRLVFIDAFSSSFTESRELGGITVTTSEQIITDLTQPRLITDTIRRSLSHVPKQGIIRGVFDSLTTVLLVSGEQRKALPVLHNKLSEDKKSKSNVLFTLHWDVHPPEIVKMVEHYMDVVIRLKVIENEENETKPILEVLKLGGALSHGEKSRFWYEAKADRVILRPL